MPLFQGKPLNVSKPSLHFSHANGFPAPCYAAMLGALRRRYRKDVPVIAIDGEDAFYHRLDSRKFLERLKASS